MIVFEQEYSDESIIDLSEDILESFDEITGSCKDIPKDPYGFRHGTFKVTIEWIDEVIPND